MTTARGPPAHETATSRPPVTPTEKRTMIRWTNLNAKDLQPSQLKVMLRQARPARLNRLEHISLQEFADTYDEMDPQLGMTLDCGDWIMHRGVHDKLGSVMIAQHYLHGCVRHSQRRHQSHTKGRRRSYADRMRDRKAGRWVWVAEEGEGQPPVR